MQKNALSSAVGKTASPHDSAGKFRITKVKLPRINAAIQNLPAITKMSWQAFKRGNKPPYMFRRGGILVRIEPDDNDYPEVKPLNDSSLRYEMARKADWYRYKKNKLVDAMPPMAVMKDMLATPDPPVPVLARIVEVPVYGIDGSLQTQQGYHKESRTLYEASKGFTLRAASLKPTTEEVDRAKQIILEELLLDFPFVDQSDCAHAISLFLLPYVRNVIDGPTPNHIVESPTPASGKGLLVYAVLEPSAGPHIGSIAQAHDGEEWRKRITACLRETREVILIDNITRPLDSGELASALTATEWEDRLLGKNEIIKMPVRCVWVTTGNNPSMSTEIARRSIRIRLDAGMERPWERKEFKHPNLLGWAKEHRADLVWAAHTLVNSWIAAGMPLFGERTLGSFERWAEIVGGILENAQIPAFLGNLDSFYEAADSENALWQEFVSLWWEKYGKQAVGVAELFDVSQQCELPFITGATDHAQRISFGAHLARQRDRIFGKYRIVSAGTIQRAALWQLQVIESESSESK
jgi:putative DNA primase/helicase